MAADGPGPARVAAVAFVLTGVLIGVGAAVAAVTGVSATAAISGVAIAAVVLVLLLRFLAGGDGADAWEPIPAEQYTGRVVQSGGLSRAEQEEAVDEVAETAEELEDAEGG